MSETIKQHAAAAAATLRAIAEEVHAGRIEARSRVDRAILARIGGAADALDAVAAGTRDPN